CKFTSGSAGTLESITIYAAYRAAVSNVKCAIFDASYNLLANGTTEEKVVGVDQDGFLTFNFSTPPTVLATTVYWLAWWCDVNFYMYHKAGTVNQKLYDVKTYNTWDDPLVPDSYEDREFTHFANLLIFHSRYSLESNHLNKPIARGIKLMQIAASRPPP
ncbi:unnamed protein product, partial [marine sediment metagenome]